MESQLTQKKLFELVFKNNYVRKRKNRGVSHRLLVVAKLLGPVPRRTSAKIFVKLTEKKSWQHYLTRWLRKALPSSISLIDYNLFNL